MSHDLKQTVAHGIHMVGHTEAGKKVLNAVGTTAVAAATTVLGPTIAAVALPAAIVTGIGWCLWKAFKE